MRITENNYINYEKKFCLATCFLGEKISLSVGGLQTSVQEWTQTYE